MKTNYQRYITSEHWRARRDAYWRSHPRVCAGCGSQDDVQLHHHTYGRMGAELDSDLVPVCQVCHSLIHEYHRLIGGSLTDATFYVLNRLRLRRERQASKVVAQAGRNNPLDVKLAEIRNRRRLTMRDNSDRMTP